jgi:hypothetical protein
LVLGPGELIRLRDLPGVQRATDLCRNPRNFEYPQAAYTSAEIAEISIRLFGITEWDTLWDIPEEGPLPDVSDEEAEYELQYEPTRLPFEQARIFWEAIGWDISDGARKELVSAHCFARQIIAVTRELVEGAAFTPDGSGRYAREDPGAEEELEDRLLREAEQFMKGRGG